MKSCCYWGKAALDAAPGPRWHLLPYHSLDVAAVGVTLLDRHDRLRNTLVALLGIDATTLRTWMGFFLSIHDLGKFGHTFQNQRPLVVEQLGGERSRLPYVVRHDSAGWAIWQTHLRERVMAAGALPSGAAPLCDVWARCATGHHGQPPTNQVGVGRVRTAQEFTPSGIDAAIEWFENSTRIVGKPTLPNGELSHLCRQAELGSWWVAGTAVLADWIGSNTAWFPYEDRQMPLTEYWQRSLRQADRAVAESGIVPVPSVPQMRFSDLWPGWQRSPLQEIAEEMPVDEPICVFMEDVMGAGKTEAALLLAHRIMAQGNADGLYWALPTMATANALFERIANVYRRLFTCATSFTLVHSQRKMVEFGGKDETATHRASAWFSEENRRALLAQVGVGTIDQALMSALHSRHNVLRLLGLVGKILVVDEAHACDAYMHRVLCVLIQLHSRAGGSVIILSATLPHQQREELANSWREGRGGNSAPLRSRAYPLITRVSPDQVFETAMGTRPEMMRRVRVVFESDPAVVVRHIVEGARSGRCVAWIRNTVRDAIEAHAALQRDLQDRVELFHARFTLADRREIERGVLSRFGRQSTPPDRAGRVLVATQVIEQSIDLDFDFMVTDVAPVDLLLQRAGRLHRHERGPRESPFLMVHGPMPHAEADKGWLRTQLPGTAAVYEDHGAIWLGVRAIARDGGFEMPTAARLLVDEVYNSAAEALMPSELQEVHQRTLGGLAADRARGRANAISVTGGYEVDGPDWWRDEYTPTRLGEPTVTFALAVFDGRMVFPMNEGAFAWALSSVTVREAALREGLLPRGAKQPDAEFDVGRWRRPLVLTRDGDGFIGKGVRGREQVIGVYYDRRRGLTWDSLVKSGRKSVRPGDG